MSSEERAQALEEYKLLAKKYALPTAESIETELGVRLEKLPSLPFFIRCIHERISNSASHLELVMHPSRMADMIESKFHTEEDKKEIFNVYKDVMAYLHEIILSVFTSQEEEAKVLKKTLKYYTSTLKPFMQKFLKAQINGWQKEVSEEKLERSYVR
ncbi:hypothetical protein HY837_01415 [archaeon]|nr:hypothetical protein [archaeon]